MNTALDWQAIEDDLNRHGCAVVPGLLDTGACLALAAQYEQSQRFRSRVVMERHGYGRGEYRYFAYPLPEPVAALRSALYPPLAAIANRWQAALGLETRFPLEHEAFLARCHAAGQLRPTPLLLRYGEGDTTVCTRTCMASMCFRCNWPCCCRARRLTLPVVNSC